MPKDLSEYVKDLSEHVENLKLSKQGRDNLFIGGAGALIVGRAYSRGVSEPFDSTLHWYTKEQRKKYSRGAGFYRAYMAIPPAILFSITAKVGTIIARDRWAEVRGCKAMHSQECLEKVKLPQKNQSAEAAGILAFILTFPSGYMKGINDGLRENARIPSNMRIPRHSHELRERGCIIGLVRAIPAAVLFWSLGKACATFRDDRAAHSKEAPPAPPRP